jgi:high affinity Mn2+ porin
MQSISLTLWRNANADSCQRHHTRKDPVPDIMAHRRQGRVKYGFGLNTEQELTQDLRVFGRLG